MSFSPFLQFHLFSSSRPESLRFAWPGAFFGSVASTLPLEVWQMKGVRGKGDPTNNAAQEFGAWILLSTAAIPCF